MPAIQQSQVATILLAGLALAVVLATASPATLPGHHHHVVHAAASVDAAPRTPAGCYRRSDFIVSLMYTPRPATTPHRLDFTVTNRVTGTRVPYRDLLVMHARRAHILVVDRTAETLVHVHPEDFAPAPRDEDGEWGVDVAAPVNGGPWVVQVEIAVRVPTSVCVEPKRSGMGNQHAQHPLWRRHTMDGDDQGPPAVEIEHEFRMPPVDGTPAAPSGAEPLPRKQENTAVVHGLRLATGSEAYTSPIPLTGLPTSSFPPKGHSSLFQVTTASFPDGRAAILPLFQNQCRTVVFHVAQYSAHWHRFVPTTDLGPLLDAAGHITAVHASTLHTAHFHGVALALSQVSAADVAHVAAQLETGFADATDARPPTRLSTPPTLAWRRGGSERVQLCRGRVGTRVWMHGAAPASFGPWIGAAVSLPLPGWWRLIVQTRVRGGDMIVAAVWVHVEPTPSRE